MTRSTWPGPGRAVLGALLALGATTGVASADQSRTVPSVTFHLADGGTVQPSDFRGKVTVIDFWASWCVPCRAAFPALDALYRQYHERGFEALAVNLDERRADADAFLAARPHVMPVAFDPKGESALAFRLNAMPSSVVIDRAGVIRFTHAGYSAKVFDSYRDEITKLLAER